MLQACLHRCDAPARLGAEPGPAHRSIHPAVLGSTAGGIGMQIRDMAAALEHALHRKERQCLAY